MPDVLQLGLPVVFSGTVPPTATDDVETIGVRVGYLWLLDDASGARWWVCRDNTEGAAIWDELSRGILVDVKNANYQIVDADHGKLLISLSGDPTLTAPAASGLRPGWWCAIKARGTTVTLEAYSGDTVDGASSVSLTSGQSAHLVRSGADSMETF